MLDKISIEKLPNILWMMAEKAEKGHEGFATYLTDRILGKASISIDQRIKGKVDVDYGALKVAVLAQVQHLQNPQVDVIEVKEVKQLATRTDD